MLPTFVLIGAMKSATTSLHYYLDLHPQISMSHRKELDFFIADRQWPNGVDWYESQFSDDAPVRGESSTGYTKYPDVGGVPERMHSILPDAKLIYMVRDPIERILSQYVHEYAYGDEPRHISDALGTLQHNRYLDISSYYLQLTQFLKFYPLDRVLTVAAEDLRDRRIPTLQRIFRFLEVDDRFCTGEFDRLLNQSAEKRRKNWLGHFLSRYSVQHYRVHASGVTSLGIVRTVTGSKFEHPVLNQRLKQKLIDALRDDVNAFRAVTGMKFDSWCV